MNRAPNRRSTWRTGVAALVFGALGVIPAGPSRGETAPAAGPAALSSFSVDADSYAVGHIVRVGQAVPVPVELYVPHTRGHIDRSPRAQAYAGLGDAPIAELGPALGAPVEPPTFCYANFPGEGEASCGIAPPGTAGLPDGFSSGTGGGTVRASGNFDRPEETRTDATVAASDQRSATVTLAHGRSTTTTEVADGVPTGVTESVAGGVVVAGVLRIDQVTSTARAAAGGVAGTASADGTTTVSGVSVAGRALRITDRGLEADGQLVALDAALGPARELAVVLAGAGVTVLGLEAPLRSVADNGTTASVAVDGVVVRVALPDGNYEEVHLGGARAAAGAVPAQAGGPAVPDVTGDPLPPIAGPINSTGPSAPPGAGSSGATAGPAGRTPSGPGGTGRFTMAPPPANEPAAGFGVGDRTPSAATGSDPTEAASPVPAAAVRVAERFRTLYGLGAIAFAAVCAAVALGGRGGIWYAAGARTRADGTTEGSQP
jgi:hypothetical protein